MEVCAKKSKPKEKPKFSHELEIRLAHEVERRPILWDATTEIYKRADLKPQVWAEVALNISPELTGEDVSSRFKNLKDTFMRNWRKVQDSWKRCSGAGADEIYKPRWNLYSSLEFLKKVHAQSASTSNIQESITATVIGDQCSQTSTLLTELHNTVYFDENLNEFMAIPSDDSCSINDLTSPVPNLLCASGPVSPDLCVLPRPSSAPSAIATGVKRPAEHNQSLFSKKGSTKKTGASLMEEAVKVMKEISKKPPPFMDPVSAAPVDREDIFASFVASRLRSMNEEQKKKCENEIMTVLMEY